MGIWLSPPPKDHAGCRQWLKEGFSLLGCDVTVSTAPPLVTSGYDLGPITCPHGVQFWHEPTGEQLMEWAQGEAAGL